MVKKLDGDGDAVALKQFVKQCERLDSTIDAMRPDGPLVDSKLAIAGLAMSAKTGIHDAAQLVSRPIFRRPHPKKVTPANAARAKS